MVSRVQPTDVRARRLPKEQRREHLLDVAADLVLERNVDAVTMENVAAAAGVSKGLGYAYFTNRSDLLLALLNREVAEQDRRVTEALAASTSFEERIRGAVHAWFDTVETRGVLLGRLLRAEQIRGPLEAGRQRYNRRLEQLFGELAAAEFGLPVEQAVVGAAILLSGLTGAIERWIGGDRRELVEETYVQIVLGAVTRPRR